ncbi:hypothetical protein ACC739_38230, partial [Rhizobium ruizarguesonis]
AGAGQRQRFPLEIGKQPLLEGAAGKGDMVWDWDVARDRVVNIPDVSIKLGLSQGAMHGEARNWLPRLHPDDRDRFRA